MKTEHCTYYGIEQDRDAHAIVGVLHTSDITLLQLRDALEPYERLRVVSIDPDLEKITGTWTSVLKSGWIVEAKAFLQSLEIVS